MRRRELRPRAPEERQEHERTEHEAHLHERDRAEIFRGHAHEEKRRAPDGAQREQFERREPA